MYVQETNSWPEFFARAKKVGKVRYVKMAETCNYTVIDEDDRGPRRLHFSTLSDESNGQYLTQLKISGIQISDKTGPLPNEARIEQLEVEVAALKAAFKELADKIDAQKREVVPAVKPKRKARPSRSPWSRTKGSPV